MVSRNDLRISTSSWTSEKPLNRVHQVEQDRWRGFCSRNIDFPLWYGRGEKRKRETGRTKNRVKRLLECNLVWRMSIYSRDAVGKYIDSRERNERMKVFDVEKFLRLFIKLLASWI